MNVEVLVIALIGVVLSADTCTYINQNKNLVRVSEPSADSNNGNTQEHVLQKGESLSISCIDDINTAFAYGAKTSFTCVSPSSDKENLPLCVSKCSKLVDLASDPKWDNKSQFLLSDNQDVTNSKIAQGTPVTLKCTDESYAQSYQQISTQACELWNVAALCKQMCDINGYDPLNTILSGNGIKPSEAKPEYLRVGFSVSISCKSADFAQPFNTTDTHTCKEDHKTINIENCFKMCRVPDAPVDTEFIATDDQLRQGQTFTVKCTGDLKFPLDQKKTEVECQDDGTFKTPYPQCQETCKLSAIDSSSTKLNKEVVGGLAQKETVEVSCKDDTYLLPYGYETPWIITCGPDNLNIDVPACQQTCEIPSTPPNAELSSIAPNTRLKLRQPVTATCKQYYSYEEPTGTSNTRQFLCSDAEGEAKVQIDEFCYVYAELAHASTGTKKVELEGKINDGKDHSNDNTTVNFTITGAKTFATIQAEPNEEKEVTVSEYEPLSVEVKTTSVVDGTNRVIKVTQDNIYPGPPSPAAAQEGSTSTTVSIKLAHPSNSELEKIVLDQPVSYQVQYMNKGDNVIKDIPKTDKDKPIGLPNLEPASTYSVNTSVVLPAEFGGRGDPEVTDVYTGPSRVDSSTVTSKVVESAVTVEWTTVDSATKYEVKLFKNGTSSGTNWPTSAKIDYVDFNSDTTYKLQIWAIREVKEINAEFPGDMLEMQLSAPPPAPKKDQFNVTTRGNSAVIKRVSATSEPSTRTNMVQTDGTEYIVFYSHSGKTDQKQFPADVEELELANLTTSSTYDITIAQAASGEGYGMKTFLKSFNTADCGTLQCENCQETTQFDYVGNTSTVKCIDGYLADKKDSKTGEMTRVKEIQLLCIGHNSYVYLDDKNIIVSIVECTDKGAVVDPETAADYTMYYIIVGVGVFLVLVLIILIIVIRKRRTQGSYNAKKAKETSKKGAASPDMNMQPKTLVNDDAFFENKWDNELLRAQSGRSKATSYGSQELRMTIADSDSGITEDLDNVYFNPALYSTNCEDDTVSTKSALV